MRYLAEDARRDWSLTGTESDVLTDSAEGVAQAIRTRLLLFYGEWFLAPVAGTPWLQKVIGPGTAGMRDIALKGVILGTPGVTGLESYFSSLNRATRVFIVSGVALSLYGPAKFNVAPGRPSGGLGYGVGPYGAVPFGE